MKLSFVVMALTALALSVSILCKAAPPIPVIATPQAPPSVSLTGPYSYENLAVFLVHDPSPINHENVLTLQEALAKKAVTIEETGQVNHLLASNNGKSSVYLQSGDIVKGGRQDRVLQHDVLLPPNAKRVALDAFCVESGRWEGRGHESSRHFSASTGSLMTKRQKLAVKVSANQGEVWSSVAAAQDSVGSKLGRSIKSGQSQSSLQLSLEDKKLNDTIDDYVRHLEQQLPSQNDVVGFAISINGAVDSVDTFASPQLFNKMKTKLLRAGAAQAVAEKSTEVNDPPKLESVKALLTDAELGASKPEKRVLTTRIVRKETPKSVVFTSDDPRIVGKSLHKSYLSK